MKMQPVPGCPAGSTLESLNIKGGGKRVCVKADAPSYLRPLPQPGPNAPWPCNGEDPFTVASPGTQAKCYGGSGSSGTQTSPQSQAPPAGMDTLRTQYLSKSTEYDAAIQQALASNDSTMLTRIRQMNTDVGSLLDKMIEQLTFAKKETPALVKERDGLVEKLRRIQQDYNGLRANTDTLETLRRIREGETSTFKRDLYRYLALFFILCVGVLLLILFVKGGSQKDSTATSATTPRMTPPLI